MSAIAHPPAASRSAALKLARLIETGRVRRIGQDKQQHEDSSDGPQHPPRWGLSLLLSRLVEISGHGASAVLTAAMGLVREAQGLGEPVAWITPWGHSFFPPDAAVAGVDLDLLLVVRIRDGCAVGQGRPGDSAILRAADIVLRSGGFGLVVMDRIPEGGWSRVGRRRPGLSLADQTRLAGLAKRHHTAFVCLTNSPADAPSLGALVTLRVEVLRGGTGILLRVLKDKSGAPGLQEEEKRCLGPPGGTEYGSPHRMRDRSALHAG